MNELCVGVSQNFINACERNGFNILVSPDIFGSPSAVDSFSKYHPDKSFLLILHESAIKSI